MSSGAVFHPGHHDLHGITVIVFTRGPRTLVGRFDAEEGEHITLNGVALHEEGTGSTGRDAWLMHTKTYGVAVMAPRAMVPREDVVRIVKLGEWTPG
jgi:hypothetical protein